MKLLELEIDKVRGIQHLLVKPNGRNFVIWGPNGSGKSAVVDAIDFLLTGRIQRLTGEGTGDISLSRHGPHIDHKPEETMVRAVVQLRGSRKSIELKRSIGEPGKLICSAKGDEELKRIVGLARQGVHILSRREILKYITANANKRALEIQELLNITEIEKTRGTLVEIKNDCLRELKNAQTAVARAESHVNATTQQQTFDKTSILGVVNQNRGILSADEISELCSANLKRNVRAPTVVSKSNGFNVTLFDRDILNLQNTLSKESKKRIGENDKKLREIIEKIRIDPDLMRTLKQLQLIELGMNMIDETGKCPLCDKAWPSGELLKYLKSRIETARVAGEYQKEIGQLVTLISTNVNTTIASLKKVIAACQVTGLKDNLAILESWYKDLEKFSVALDSAMENYLETGWTSEEIGRSLAPENIIEVLGNVSNVVKEKYPESTPEQITWDTLTRLEENLRSVENAEEDAKKAQLYVKRASFLHNHFLLARDKVLGQLYEAIKDRFVGLYRELHADDEEKFGAKIEPKEAGLNFEVEFYGRGTHPPHALHSEGHQDSMGLCLFLALAEHLTKGLIDLIVLDDVVMSVDGGHRRRLCQLLAKNFPDRQFLITTHDKTWAKQLQTEGVVKSEGSIEFYNWCLELGPQVDYEVNLWKHIKNDLDRGDVPSAAHKLRRGCEDYFGQVCDFLQAQVRYKLDGRYELGDFLPAAMSRYGSLIKKAELAARTWGNQESLEKLTELESTVSQINKRCGIEQWAINANVHYSNWANFSKNDFQPVTEAFEDLCKLFVCSTCAGMLHVTTKGLDLENVRCNCGSVNWNLIPQKGKTQG
jgi:energy-coupling factor transporter ATP-binding protein EcfA2